MKSKLIYWCALITLVFLCLPATALAADNSVGVAYRGHIQDLGDYPTDGSWVDSPEIIGTEGQSKRIEGFEIKLTGEIPAGMELRYNVHVQNKGWLYDENDSTNWPKDGDYAGTRGEGLRIEAVKIFLTDSTGQAVSGYSVQYRGHVQNVGDLPADKTQWLADGAQLGTVGSSQRLEALLVQVIKTAVAPVVYEKAGIYGSATESQTIAGDVIIAADGVTLQNLVIEGNLTISEAVGNGTVTLNNVTVKGDTLVRGGGINSIHINGGKYRRIVMEKTASGAVRIVATGVDGLAVVISEDAAGETIILEGAFDSITVNAPNMTVTTQGNTTTIGKLTVGVGAAGSTLNLATGTTVTDLVLDGTAAVKGQGTVTRATINADGVVFEKAPGAYTVAPNVVIPPVFPTPNNGGGGGGPSIISVTDVSLDKTTLTLLVDGSEKLTETVLPINATTKTVTWTSDKTNIATVDATTGVVTGKSPGTATITATTTSGKKTASCAITIKEKNLAAEIKGVTIPFDGDHPVTTITETDQYSGTITWSEAGSNLTAASVFDGSKSHAATITLTLKEPYTTDQIGNNYFSVSGATSYNINKSTKITAYFNTSDQYRVDATHGNVITAYSGPGKVLVLPEKINEITITEIAANAFQNKNMNEITIPDSVSTIASGAFAGNALTKITLGANVVILDDTALGVNGSSFITVYVNGYHGQPTLKGNYLFVNDAWQYSGNQVGKLWFNDSGTVTGYEGAVKNLVIPDGNGIIAIAPEALTNKGIKTLNLPDAVKTIGVDAFKGNPIIDIRIGTVVTVDGTAALGNETVSFLDAYTINGAGNYHCYYDIATTLPSWCYSNVVVNGMAFNMGSQTINSYNGSGGDLTIPTLFNGTEAKTILQDSFRGMNLTGLAFGADCKITNIGASAFYQNTIKNLILPNSITTIGGGAFQNCQLESVVLSSSLTTIEIGAFSTNQLTSITIPDSVTEIGKQAFVVNKLTSVVIEGTDGSDLTIKPGAFQSISVDTNLITAITVPANVTIPDATTMGKYGAAFKTFYEDAAGNNKSGGVFNYDSGSGQWSKQ